MNVANVPTGMFYETYHGHEVDFLESVLASLRKVHGDESPCIFFAGDSSLDNKTWLFNQGVLDPELWRPSRAHAPAVNGYEDVLEPPRMVCDVTYWANKMLADARAKAYVVNTAVEATLLATRVGGCHSCCFPSCGCINAQDKFIRNNVRAQDMIVISVGGNDVALAPSIITIISLILLLLTPLWLLKLMGCCHPGLAYFVFLFKRSIERYAQKLTCKVQPAKIGVCMIYFLDERNGQSWANLALCCLCYSFYPALLQSRLLLVYDRATSRVRIPGSVVVPIPLFEALDGKCTEDYQQRVEPSIIGGRKMSHHILRKLGFGMVTNSDGDVRP